MRITTALLFLSCAPLLAEGPVYHHKDVPVQQEFENVYQDVRSKKSKIGVIDGSSANSFEVGESSRAYVASGSAVSSTGNGVWFDITSITLKAGDWDISAQVFGSLNGATMSAMAVGIGSAAGNSTTGFVNGDNNFNIIVPTGSLDGYGAIAGYRVSITAATNYYLKAQCAFSAGTPKAYGRISARRMR